MNVHHTAICTRDMEASLRFWRDGLGFDQLMDERFGGDWPALFGSRQSSLHSIFLGHPDHPDCGLVELVDFEGEVDAGPGQSSAPAVGFFLISVYTEVPGALGRLEKLGLGGTPSKIVHPPGITMAVVHDPNGVRVELIDLGQTGGSSS